MENKELRLMALSAPHWVKKVAERSVSLNSRSPFSLQNAVRLAASKALSGEGTLGKSNWSSRDELRDTVFLMEYWEDEKESLAEKLREVRPNVLFIGSMTLAFPGAIEVAKLAKEILGEEVFIILGGKHTNETFFDGGGKLGSNIQNTKGSPLRLMKESKIDRLFDLVCSGPAEELIAAVTEKIGELLEQGKELKEIYNEIEGLTKTVKGDWRAGWVNDGEVEQFQSLKLPIDYNEMPVPAEVFGIKGKFDVFGTEITAHAFSDTSPGCVFDCFFCSERSSINPRTQDRNHAADRLFRQLKSIKEVAERENHTNSVSVFVEDSTLLNIGRDPAQIYRLAELMKKDGLHINFGGQFTVDELLDPKIQEALVELKEVGFSYVFTGMETEDEEIAGTMAKNLTKGAGDWVSRNEQVVSFLKEVGIKYGVSVLFGLGEKQETRLKQLDQIKNWQAEYGEPVVVSLNLATVHPLQETGLDEDFIEWGTKADSPHMEDFQRLFGEASDRYAVDKEHLPTVQELKGLEEKYWELRLDQEIRGELRPERGEEGKFK
jgi:B12-binding domain/radical SAM domain protein